MKPTQTSVAIGIIITLAAVSIGILLSMSPIPQDIAYHSFADTKAYLGVPNFLNVISNLPFLLVGLLGAHWLRKRELTIEQENIAAYYALFVGTALVAFGSGYFHLWPGNHTLLWDRLPMTIAFMGLVSIITAEFCSVRLGKVLLLPLLVFGVASVLYWHFTEASGQGDLRPYVFVQFFPMLAIPVALLMMRSSFSLVSAYWWLFAAYLAAKAFEHFDFAVQGTLVFVSGHSIKHLVAALGMYVLLLAYRERAKRPKTS